MTTSDAGLGRTGRGLRVPRGGEETKPSFRPAN
jgi:hypothetical protein